MAKVTVEKAKLARAILTASKAVSSSPMVPLLANVLIKSDGRCVSVSGTNIEIGVTAEFEAEGDEFAVCVPSKTISDLMNAIYSEDLKLEMDEDDQSLVIETDTSNTKVKYMSAEDYPSIPEVTVPSLMLPVIQLKEMINRVAFCAKDGAQGSTLSGVLLAIEDPDDDDETKDKEKKSKMKVKGKFIMFATDGYHFSFEKFNILSGNATPGTKAIVRSDVLELLNRLLPNEGMVMIEIGENKAMFQCEDINIVTQLMTGEFPDHNMFTAVLPNEFSTKTEVTLNTIDLLRAAKQLKVFAVDTPKTKMEVLGMVVRYSIQTQNRGGSETEIIGVTKGKELAIGVNVHFLLMFLEVCKTPQVVIKFIDTKSAILLLMKDVDTYYHVIMPIAL